MGDSHNEQSPHSSPDLYFMFGRAKINAGETF